MLVKKPPFQAAEDKINHSACSYQVCPEENNNKKQNVHKHTMLLLPDTEKYNQHSVLLFAISLPGSYYRNVLLNNYYLTGYSFPAGGGSHLYSPSPARSESYMQISMRTVFATEFRHHAVSRKSSGRCGGWV